jgi:hypothetical protein
MKRTVSKPAVPSSRRKIEDELDQALMDSFPASDPVSLIVPGPREPLAKRSKAAGKKKQKR